MAFRPDHKYAGKHAEHRTPSELSPSEQYLREASRLRALIDFMRSGGRWEQLDNGSREQHRMMLRLIEDQKATDVNYRELSLAQVAEDLIQRYEAGAKQVELASLLTVGEVVQLPELFAGKLQVVKVDQRSRSYILANVKDRRSPDEIQRAVWAGETLPNGEPVGFEVDWNALEALAA